MKAWFKSLKNRAGINAPKVAVRAHMPWHTRWIMVAGIGLAIAGVMLYAISSVLFMVVRKRFE